MKTTSERRVYGTWNVAMFNIVYSVFKIFFLTFKIYSVFKDYSVFIQDIQCSFKIHSKSIQYLFKIYSIFFQDFIQDSFKIYLMFILDLFNIHSRSMLHESK